ncbi:hypothetical protein BGZ83_001256 [Gryganskiella cystojenkinii]|nr:hypothetical protein BGZ83_001256 [Gryganskiella cystojenkinii]
MLGSTFSSSRSALSPHKELDLANTYLETARTTKDQEISLTLCNDAEAALSRMKRAAKKALTSPVSVEDQVLRNGIATAYFEHGERLVSLGYTEMAQTSYKKAEKWGTVPGPAVSFATDSAGSDIARVPEDIFPDDMRQPTTKCTLPNADERLSDTSQLAYCLGLLQVTPSPGEEFETTACNWVKATENNAEETERLRTLGIDVIRAFSRDELKDAKAVKEVVCLAPVLEKEYFHSLLTLFVDGVDKSSLLDVQSLEGLAQLVQSAPMGYLDADDLVTILHNLNTRLQDTHGQSSDHIYRLTLAVSNVLDAMADTKVSGLKRVELHEPLSAYLEGLRGSNDPYLVYQAAYAFQALQCISDNESPWQATMRRTGIVLKGISGLVSAVKGLDVNGFIQGLARLQEGLGEVIQVAKIGYEGVSALVESGQGLLESFKAGLSFDRKRAWYTALRGADTLLRDGQLTKLKTLVCEVSCRRDVAFQLGVCQRLGDLAADTRWDAESRQGAVAFLGEIYRNDDVWGRHVFVKQWILHILMKLASTFGSTLPGVKSLLQELESNGDLAKRTLYQGCSKEDRNSHPLKVTSPPTISPSLLDRVQNKPDVEVDLRRLRKQRIQERGAAIYIPPQAKANLQASDDNLFNLTEYVECFLSSKQYKVMLLLGDSGAGKSTFNRAIECNLWSRYNKGEGRIPLYINLPTIDKPEQDLIAKHLRRNDFTETQIRELKDYREFVLICDGYDESQQMYNMYTSNQLNQTGQWRAQMVISCRSEYLPHDYRDRFQPTDRNQSAPLDLFVEAVVAPFSAAQIEDYVQRYVLANRPLWRSRDYLDALGKMPGLLDLVKNPFLLTLSLEVLPRMMDPGQQVSTAQITRVELYDQFVEQWLERGNKRLGDKKDMSRKEKEAFERLTDDDFTQNGITFLKDLAGKIFKHQAGNPVVEYSPKRDQGTWKESFFNRNYESQLLLEASPLTRSGNQYRFIHKSLLEYCVARAVFEPQKCKKILGSSPAPARRGSVNSMFSFEDRAAPEEDPVDIQKPVVDHPLMWRSFVGEPSILQFLAERVQQEPHFKQQLLGMIEHSKIEKESRKAAANAITILVRAGIRFNRADLRGIQVPGADLSGGEFDSAQLQGADLRKANLRNIWLHQANLNNAQMAGVEFGEWPYLVDESEVYSIAYSPDGTTCAVGIGNGTISVYDTTTWAKTHTLSGHTKEVTSVVYSPNGQQIASGSEDRMVHVWDAQSGTHGLTLSGHTHDVRSVAYSPNGQQIASGSYDSRVRLWDAQTGAPGFILIGHTDSVNCVVFSPRGHQLASASYDFTVRLWDVQTGAVGHILRGHVDMVCNVVYSPSGQQIASGSRDTTVQLWDAQTGAPGPILRGHTDDAKSVVYSPSGQQIASGSYDRTVRLWDAQTGAPGPILSGHSNWVTSVAYSPSGQQIASCSYDKTVRLWDAKTSAPSPILSGHTKGVTSVVYSPNGQQIASGSLDNTVRLWDAQAGTPGLTFNGHTDGVTSAVYSPSGQQIASCSYDKTVRLWDAQTGASGPILHGHTHFVYCVAYSPSGQQLASGSRDGTVRLWDAETGASGPILRGHTTDVTSVVYSPSGQHITCSSDDTVRLWDSQTGLPGPILSGHTGDVTSVVYSPSGHQIATGSWDMTVRLWDAQTGAPGPILSGHIATVARVVYSPNGQQIASGSWDMTVRLWEAQTGVAGPVLTGHTMAVTSVVYSPSGKQIASGSDDKTVRLWNVNSGQCLAVVNGFHGEIKSIAWNATPNGTYFATGCGDKSVRIWQFIEEDSHYHARLHQSSMHESLTVSNTYIENVHGLSRINVQLLKQRFAVGEPIPPSSFREASKKLISIASMVSQLKLQPNHRSSNTSSENIPLSGQSAQPIELSEVSQLSRASHNWIQTKTSLLQEVDSASDVGNCRDSSKAQNTTLTCTVAVMEELKKEQQEHTDLLSRQQQQSEEQKQCLHELKDDWQGQIIRMSEQLKEQQKSYEVQISELKDYLSTLLMAR